MSKNPESPRDRLKKIALWQWGLLLIVAGFLSNAIVGLQQSTGDSAAERGQVLGRGVATLLFVVAGIAFIIAHFVHRNRR